MQGIQDFEPLFLLCEEDRERSGYHELADFLQAFPNNAVTRDGDILYAKYKDRFFAYDLANQRLSVYSTSTWNSQTGSHARPWTDIRSTSDLVVTTSSYCITSKTPPLNEFKTSRPQLLKEVNVNDFRKVIPPP